MQVEESKIIADVKTAIDENTKILSISGETFDTDTLEMEDIIKSKIVDAVNSVRNIAPLSMLDLTRKVSGTDWNISWIDEDKCIGEIPLPDDYLKLVMFKMSDWQHAVTTPIPPNNPLYHQQFSEWKGVRGNPSRPNISIASDMTTGKAVIQFFSCDDTSATAELTYIKRFEAPAGTSYDIDNPIYRAVVLKIAALVAATYQSGDLMNLLNTLSQENLN